jgi:hypothetical protein
LQGGFFVATAIFGLNGSSFFLNSGWTFTQDNQAFVIARAKNKKNCKASKELFHKAKIKGCRY